MGGRHLPAGGDAPWAASNRARLGPGHRTAGDVAIRPVGYSRTVSAEPRRARRGAAMPIVNIDLAWLNRLLGKPYPPRRSRIARPDRLRRGGRRRSRADRCPQCGSLVENPLGQDEVKACGFCGFESETPFKGRQAAGDAARSAWPTGLTCSTSVGSLARFAGRSASRAGCRIRGESCPISR